MSGTTDRFLAYRIAQEELARIFLPPPSVAPAAQAKPPKPWPWSDIAVLATLAAAYAATAILHHGSLGAL